MCEGLFITIFNFPQFCEHIKKIGNYKATIRRMTMLKNTHPDSFEIPKTFSKMVYVTPCASLYGDAANGLSGDVGSSTKLVGVKTSLSHKALSRRLNVVRLMRIFPENSSSLFWL